MVQHSADSTFWSSGRMALAIRLPQSHDDRMENLSHDPDDADQARPPSDPANAGLGVECLTRIECLELIAQMSVGRIAVIGPNGAPHVVPVNYVVESEAVVFCTDEGSKFTAMLDQTVTFQVDFVDPFHRTGWSVMIQARPTFANSSEASPDSWVGAALTHRVRVDSTTISGRRIRLPEIEVDVRGYL